MIQKKREKGEIVWVRVSLSQTCWPALVLRAFQDSVLVSFFSLPQFPPPRYVLDSLLLSFPDNFRSLAPSAPHALLHRALRLYGLKTLSSLTCPCQGKTTPRRRFENNAATATAKTAPFKKAEDVLGFVFIAAVSPWVEKAEFVEAVESMAFVHAFRGYKSAKLRGNKNKNSAAHESDILGLEDEFQLLSQELEKNLEAGVTNGMSSKVPFLTETFNPLHEHQLSHTRLQQSKEQSVNEVLVSLHCLSLDPFYLVGKCLKTVEHNVLRFRSLSFQNISDFCFKKCLHPKSPKTHFSDPGYTKTESGVKVDRKQSCGEIFCPFLSYMAAPVNNLGLKRKLDQPSNSYHSLKVHKTMQFSSDATAKTAPFKKAEDVLGFVFSAAVSPWVEKAEFVETVEATAFVHAFRGYKSAKLRGNKNKNSAAHESDILGLEDEFQLLSQELEKNLEAGVTNGMSSKVPFLTESFNPLHEHQLSHTRLQQSKEQSVNEVLVSLHCLSLDPFYLVGKCLKTVEHNVLRFRSLSFQNISDFCFKKCLHPKSPETHFSDPGYTKTESGVKVDRKQSCGEIFCPLLSYMAAPVNNLGLKRKLDQPSNSYHSLKVHKTMQFSSDATAKTAPFKKAEDLLGFVFSAAVSPWVEKAEFVETVEATAFVHAFRGYKSAKLRGNKNKNSIAHELDILELEDEFQLLSQELEKNLEAGVTNGMSSKVPFLTESYNLLHKHQLSHTQLKQSKEQSVNEVLVSLHCLALDPFYLVGKCLKTVEHNVLRFRSLSFQNISDFCFKKCLHPKSPETHFSDPGYTKTESGVKVDRKQSSGEIFCPFLSYMAAPVNRLGLKRKLDQPSNSYRSLKVHKTMQFSLDAGTSAYLQKNKAGHKENSTLSDPSFKLCMTMPLFSLNGSDSYLSRKHSSGFQVELINALFPSSPAKLKMRHHSSTKPQSLTYLCNNNLMDLVQNKFNISLPGGASHCGEVEISKLQESAENFDSLNDTRASISSVDCILATKKFPSQSDFTADKIKMLPCDIDDATSIRSDKEASINVAFGDSSKENKELYQPVTSDSSFKLQRGQLEAFDTIAYSLHLKFPKDFELPSKQELVEKFSPFGIVDSLRTKIFSYISAAKVVFLHPTDAVAAYQYANKERVLFGEANIRVWLDPLGQKRIGTEFSAPPPLLTGKPVSPKRCQHVTSDSSFKSQRDQQLEALATTASTSLHMKFPKDFKLPSKQELVKKFSRFGTVDSSKTKVFSCTGAAQVVFLHPTDAVAAYHYAKKKRVVFGEANVRFWLDPLDHKRRGTKFSAPPPLLTGKPVNLKRHQHVTTDSSYKSQMGQQLEELATTAASTSLHMKFPKDVKLPSTQDVVKKFSRFGTVDSFRTNVSSCTGAAQVVFLQPTDAVAAYKYAKKKRVMFGEANVRFWLDPLDHKRRGTKFSVSPPSLTETEMNLKSCLRKSSPLECRDKKKPHKVRFLMVT